MNQKNHVPAEMLQEGLRSIRDSPKTNAILDLIVRRPGADVREALCEAQLDEADGLIGDSWIQRGSSRTPDGRPHPEMQLTIMNSRLISLIAGSRDRWTLAGDQLYVDLDLSTSNLPAGSRLRVGNAVVEITAQPHTGCSKFKARFGADALAFVNSPVGRELRLRGVNARIVSGGVIRVGDNVVKL
jgi:hypothetical protein